MAKSPSIQHEACSDSSLDRQDLPKVLCLTIETTYQVERSEDEEEIGQWHFAHKSEIAKGKSRPAFCLKQMPCLGDQFE